MSPIKLGTADLDFRPTGIIFDQPGLVVCADSGSSVFDFTTVFSIRVPTSFLRGYSATLAAKLFIKLELS